jgi:hypothetical protein
VVYDCTQCDDFFVGAKLCQFIFNAEVRKRTQATADGKASVVCPAQISEVKRMKSVTQNVFTDEVTRNSAKRPEQIKPTLKPQLKYISFGFLVFI